MKQLMHTFLSWGIAAKLVTLFVIFGLLPMAAVGYLGYTPEYLKGVLNLRGTIVPIIDLRLKFGMGATEPTPFTVVVVANVKDRVMGILADAVSDVLEIADKDIQPPPELGSKVDVSFIAGIGSCNDHLVTLQLPMPRNT